MVLLYINYLCKNYNLEISENTNVNLLKDIIYNLEYKEFNYSDIIKNQIKENMKIIYNDTLLSDNYKFDLNNLYNLNLNENENENDKIQSVGYNLKIIQKPIVCLNHLLY